MANSDIKGATHLNNNHDTYEQWQIPIEDNRLKTIEHSTLPLRPFFWCSVLADFMLGLEPITYANVSKKFRIFDSRIWVAMFKRYFLSKSC